MRARREASKHESAERTRGLNPTWTTQSANHVHESKVEKKKIGRAMAVAFPPYRPAKSCPPSRGARLPSLAYSWPARLSDLSARADRQRHKCGRDPRVEIYLGDIERVPDSGVVIDVHSTALSRKTRGSEPRHAPHCKRHMSGMRLDFIAVRDRVEAKFPYLRSSKAEQEALFRRWIAPRVVRANG
jgi:hypothetical protein